jgi:glycosyltransferase involved in cell wall biosynthesis
MSTSGPVLIGAFPPPVGGAALVNQRVADALSAAGVRPSILNVGAPRLHVKGFAYHLYRLLANARAIVSVVLHRPKVIYIVPDGGNGLIYSLVICVACCLLLPNSRYFLHHHTHRYVGRHDAKMHRIVRVLGERCTHVFLTLGMAEAFQRLYGKTVHLVSTNAHLAERPEPPPARRFGGPLKLGHLSNLCREKGFFEVVAAFDILAAAGTDVHLSLAGPILEVEVDAALQRLMSAHPGQVTHRGPVQGSEKLRFYDEIDVFLFPTRFAQEAAPLVLYEAAAAAVPWIFAVDRGCIAEILGNGTGYFSRSAEEFPSFVAAMMDARGDPAVRSQSVATLYETALSDSKKCFVELVSLIAELCR